MLCDAFQHNQFAKRNTLAAGDHLPTRIQQGEIRVFVIGTCPNQFLQRVRRGFRLAGGLTTCQRRNVAPRVVRTQ